VPYTAVQFLALQQARALEARLGASPARTHALAFANGALAGAAGTVASYPFDLLRTTLAAQGEPRVYAGMADAARGIVGAGGARGLYRGLGVTLLEIMPYAALQFGLYDVFSAAADRTRAARRGGAGAAAGGSALAQSRGADALQAVACGLAAGTLAKLGTHPLDVAKKRFQVAGLARAARYGERVSLASVRSLRACVAEIFAREGAAGFYKGAVPSVAKAAPAAAVTFFVYELVVGALAAPGEASGAAARRPQH
jgi:solute carrier family 25 thiamine pyrophosphate transporter 19